MRSTVFLMVLLVVDGKWRARWRKDHNRTIPGGELREAKLRLAQMCPHATKSPFYPSDDLQAEQGLSMGPFYIDDTTVSSIFVNHIPKTGGTATVQYLKKTVTDFVEKYSQYTGQGPLHVRPACFLRDTGCRNQQQPLRNGKPNAEQCRLPARSHNESCAITYAHADWCLGRQLREVRNVSRVIAVSTLRDPAARLLSTYEHWHRYTVGRKDHNFTEWIAGFGRDNEGFERWFMQYEPLLANLQTRIVAGSIDVQHEELAHACGIDVSNIKLSEGNFASSLLHYQPRLVGDDVASWQCVLAARTQLIDRDLYVAYAERERLRHLKFSSAMVLEQAKFNLCNSWFVILEQLAPSILVLNKGLGFPDEISTMEIEKRNVNDYSGGYPDSYDIEGIKEFVDTHTAEERQFYTFAMELLGLRVVLMRPRPHLDLRKVVEAAVMIFESHHMLPSDPARFNKVDLDEIIGMGQITVKQNAGDPLRLAPYPIWIALTHDAQFLYRYCELLDAYLKEGEYRGYRVADLLQFEGKNVVGSRVWGGRLNLGDFGFRARRNGSDTEESHSVDKDHAFLLFRVEGGDDEWAVDFCPGKLTLLVEATNREARLGALSYTGVKDFGLKMSFPVTINPFKGPHIEAAVLGEGHFKFPRSDVMSRLRDRFFSWRGGDFPPMTIFQPFTKAMESLELSGAIRIPSET